MKISELSSEVAMVKHSFKTTHDSFGSQMFNLEFDFSNVELSEVLSLAVRDVVIKFQASKRTLQGEAEWKASAAGKIDVAEVISPKARASKVEQLQSQMAAQKLFTDTLMAVLAEGKDLKTAQAKALKITQSNYSGFNI